MVRDGNESALIGPDRSATGFDTDSALPAAELLKMQERVEVMQLGRQLLLKAEGDLGGFPGQKAQTGEEGVGHFRPIAVATARCCGSG